jgi:hypothetical protein
MWMRYRFFASALATVLATGAAALVALMSMLQGVNAGDPAKISRGKALQKTPRPGAQAVMRSSPVPRPESLMLPDPATVYRVEPIPVRGIVQLRTPQQEQSLKAASALVSRLRPIPEDRIRFFGWMNEANSPAVFAGWGVFVQQAVPTPDGQLILLRVSALATTRSGGHIGVMNNFIEEYLWSNGSLRYLKGYPCPILGEKPVLSRL